MLGLSLLFVQILYTIAAVLGLLLAAVLWQNREKPGAKPLLVGNVCVGIWSIAQLGSIIAVETFESTEGGMLFSWILYPTIAVTTIAVFIFGLEYTGRERYITRKLFAGLALYPLAVLFFAVVNPDGVFYTDFVTVVEGTRENLSHHQGPAFIAHTVTGYALVAATFAMIVELLLRSGRPLYRGQALSLLGALSIPFVFNVLTITGNVRFDLTVVGFIASSSLFTVAIVRYRLIDVTPIARKKVVENVRDGMFVVDTGGTVLDSNPSFQSLMNTDEDSLVGADVATLLQNAPDLLEVCNELRSETPKEEGSTVAKQRRTTYGDRHLNIEASPMYDDRDRLIGWLFLVHDVTELVQRERDLEGQIEKLDQFAGIVSHDLRNPLNVARGYVQQAKTTGDLSHLERAEEAMERMETIIEEALTIAREGEDITEPETVSLESVATDAWASVETEGASFQTENARLRADSDRFQRLLENLFRNSIEHGIDGESHPITEHEVTVRVTGRGPDKLTVSVADNGVGIADDDLEQVLEGGFTTNTDGTGLGLAIVEQIASAHGWEVEANHSETGGARFDLHDVAKPV